MGAKGQIVVGLLLPDFLTNEIRDALYFCFHPLEDFFVCFALLLRIPGRTCNYYCRTASVALFYHLITAYMFLNDMLNSSVSNNQYCYFYLYLGQSSLNFDDKTPE